ncbi:hypothetical protein HaLaN_21238 [Haematococcus lacustris]|uniref:Uncharacterized protein n=1 Tax=Haematococcus lacustris TaxID=44745 RepID=A0A699ZLR6_HAELA|nr:hypothetical protein HaLaN_21238 [Haematococcus lacustris]
MGRDRPDPSNRSCCLLKTRAFCRTSRNALRVQKHFLGRGQRLESRPDCLVRLVSRLDCLVLWSAMDGTIQSYNGVHMAPAEVMAKAAASTFSRDWYKRMQAYARKSSVRMQAMLTTQANPAERRQHEPAALPAQMSGRRHATGCQAPNRTLSRHATSSFMTVDNIHLQAAFQLLGLELLKEKHYRTQLLDELYKEVKQVTMKELRELAKIYVDGTVPTHGAARKQRLQWLALTDNTKELAPANVTIVIGNDAVLRELLCNPCWGVLSRGLAAHAHYQCTLIQLCYSSRSRHRTVLTVQEHH